MEFVIGVPTVSISFTFAFMYKNLLKPLLDFLAALIGLVLLGPLFLLITLALAIVNNGKPFFFQRRPGKHERIFSIIKFKTMNDKIDTNGLLLPDTARLTSVGRWVRKTSLDELPQLINVLKGDMSLVGPRPLLISYLSYYTDLEKRRHDVRPGITGLAQINGRNTSAWNERLAFDVYYVENMSFILDFKIFLLTIYKVIKRDNVVVDPQSILKDLDEDRRISHKKV